MLNKEMLCSGNSGSNLSIAPGTSTSGSVSPSTNSCSTGKVTLNLTSSVSVTCTYEYCTEWQYYYGGDTDATKLECSFTNTLSGTPSLNAVAQVLEKNNVKLVITSTSNVSNRRYDDDDGYWYTSWDEKFTDTVTDSTITTNYSFYHSKESSYTDGWSQIKPKGTVTITLQNA